MKFDFQKLLPQYEINTPLRRAAFMAQVHHESAGFTRIEENLNYSTQGLIRTWPGSFHIKNAGVYAHQPQKIANRAYANRMGNGPESSGDGWRYRGRGLIQITGKSNYSAFASYKGMSPGDVVLYLGTPDGALESACWYWKTHNLNQYADQRELEAITRKINGGLNGLNERNALFHQYLIAELPSDV
jgi:putative chitinase